MKFECRCGTTIHDKTDSLPHKAHVIADQDWFDLLDGIDDAVVSGGPDASDKEATCRAIRSLIHRCERPAFRCRVCGRIHVTDATRTRRVFAPEDGADGSSLFAAIRDATA